MNILSLYKKLPIVLVCALISFGLKAQNQTYTSRSLFSASANCTAVTDNFDNYLYSSTITTACSGAVQFSAPYPIAFYGTWNFSPSTGSFYSAALLPQPGFVGSSLNITFPTEVYGVGLNVFDDFDGNPLVNTITLTAVTTTGQQITISESSATTGDCGFIGATSVYGLVSATVSINNTSGANLEADLLTIIPMCAGLDTDGDQVPNSTDNCLLISNKTQADSDCDGVGDMCDLCPGGDDKIDTDHDGTPDCADFDGISSVPVAYRCGNSNTKVRLCFLGHELCVTTNALPALMALGAFIGDCDNDPCGLHMSTDQELQIEGDAGIGGLVVYPNPAIGELNLSFTAEPQENAIVRIKDITGRTVVEQKLSKELNYKVSLQNTLKGMYFLEVQENGEVTWNKTVLVN